VDLSTCLDLSLGYLATGLGLPEDIPEWLREGEFGPSHSIPQTNGFIRAVHGKALVLLGDHARLDAVARALPAGIGPFNNLFVRIHGKLQESLAARHAHGPERALEALEAALDLARPDGIALTVAEYGAHVLPLLRTLAKRNPKDAYLAGLVRLAARYPCCVNSRASSAARMRKANLTPREEEVVLRAAKGESNEEIAGRLGISAVTVKKLLSSAYARLGAKNRAEAVRRFVESASPRPRG
jgi:LuxR family maltose regulon positive regulatory protein